MNTECNANAPRWYVVNTNAKQEDRAASNLRAWQVETFSPRIKEKRYNQFTNQPVLVSRPLFPRYIFARFDRDLMLHKVSNTRGVHSVINFNNCPAFVDDDVIAFMQSQVNADGFVEIGRELKTGDTVVIERGPFKNLIGVFERTLKEQDRVMILLTSFSYQSRIVIDKAMVKRVGCTNH